MELQFQSTRPRGTRYILLIYIHATFQVSIHASARDAITSETLPPLMNIVSIHASARDAISNPHGWH